MELKTIKIKKLKLKNPFLLAPMLEPNDIAFRLLCKKAGCSLTYTGMTSPKTKQKLNLQDKPALQLFASDTTNLKQFIKKYNSKVSLWDFNLGCPSSLSKKQKHGAFLQDLNKIKQILTLIRQSTKKPISIKLRKTNNTIKIAKLAQDIGIDLLAIHPRTIQQGYSGESDIKYAEKLQKQISIPIIYSGDVNLKNYKKLLKKFPLLMIGRGAIGHPQIFQLLLNKKPTINFKDYMALADKYKLSYKQIKYQAMNFTKYKKGAKQIRFKLAKTKTIEQIKEIMSSN